MEKQRARVDCLRDGDRNTALFQAKSRARAQRNKISTLKREDGSVAVQQEELEEVALDFYKQLFSAQDELEPNLILEHVPSKITEEMNERLMRPFVTDEVERALQMMKASKAPGPDGFCYGAVGMEMRGRATVPWSYSVRGYCSRRRRLGLQGRWGRPAVDGGASPTAGKREGISF